LFLDMNYNTSLILASSKGKVEAVRVLLRKGARVRPKNNLGATCLHAAADSGQINVAKQLINVEAMDYNMQDEQGYTPLHLAVMSGHEKMAILLLGLGAKVDIPDFAKRTVMDEVKVNPHKFQTFLNSIKPISPLPVIESDSSSSTKIITNQSPKANKGNSLVSKFFGRKDSKEIDPKTNPKILKPSSQKKENNENKNNENKNNENKTNENKNEIKKQEEEKRRKIETEDRENELKKKKLEEDLKRKTQEEEEAKRKQAEEQRRKDEKRKRHEEKQRKIKEEEERKRQEEERKLEEEKRAQEKKKDKKKNSKKKKKENVKKNNKRKRP